MIRALAPAVQTALRVLAQHAAPRDRDRLREAGRRGMGPTPAVRRARARVLAAISAAERRRRAAVRAGDRQAAAHFQGEATRLRRRLARLDARRAQTHGDAVPGPRPGDVRDHITRKEGSSDRDLDNPTEHPDRRAGAPVRTTDESPSAPGRGADEEETGSDRLSRPA